MNVLVFSRTTGYRHDSIPAGLAALFELGREYGIGVVATEDPGVLADNVLPSYAAVVFLNTSGEVFAAESDRQPAGAHRTAFEAYIRGGGGFVGVHCAAHTETGWPFYVRLIGAGLARHPKVQPGTIRVEVRDHPATAHLDEVWTHTDEWYDFDVNPRPSVRVLLSLDESSYDGGAMGGDHPIAWCHENLGGRAFYTGLGHTVESYAEPDMRAHLLGAIRWTAGAPRR